MTEQRYENHARMVPHYHYTLFAILLVSLGASLYNIYRAMQRGSGRFEAGIILLLVVAGLFLAWYARVFALKAQDRAIRAEEQLRYFILTGSALDPRLSIRQIIGLRFAADEELAALATRAADEALSEKEIKKAISNWRADTYRV